MLRGLFMVFLTLLSAAGALVLVTNTAVSQTATQCDDVAAHPDDPNGLVNGVYDGDVVLQLAIPACESALQADPDNPRLQFQLARSYWEADRDAEAIDLFRKAALEGGYAAAYAFLGIAYEYGYVTGSPEIELARSLYLIARQGNFLLADDLLAALPSNRPMHIGPTTPKVSFSSYHQPEILQNIFDEEFDNLNKKSLQVVLYMRGMYEFFKQEVNWFDLRCAHLHDTRLTQKVVRNLMGIGPQQVVESGSMVVDRVLEQVHSKIQSGDIIGLVTGIMEAEILPDEGKRDAGRLVTDNDNNCEADAIKRLYKNAQYYFLHEMSFN